MSTSRKLMQGACTLAMVAFGVPADAQRAQRPAPHAPIIDMHVHAQPADAQGPPGGAVCAGDGELIAPDPGYRRVPMQCPRPLHGAMSDAELMQRTLAIMEKYNVIGVASGPMKHVWQWKAAAPSRIIVSVDEEAPRDSIRPWIARRAATVMGEFGFQYEGLAPGDARAASYLALGDSLGVPVGLHVGLGPPGAAHIGVPKYRIALGNPSSSRRPRSRTRIFGCTSCTPAGHFWTTRLH